MATGENTHLTIAEYAARHGISATTVRRRIKDGVLRAELKDGRYLIAANQNGYPTEYPNGDPTEGALVDQMHAEITHLRAQVSRKDDQLSSKDTQIDQLNQLLAMTTRQNSALTNQLPATERIAKAVEDPAPKQPILTRLRSLFGSQA